MVLRSLDLFTGIGGLTLALEGVARPVAYCEWAPSCQRVLRRAMADNRLPTAPVHGDIRTLRGSAIPRIDLVVGGFPCVGFSRFGKQEGFDESQSSLFFEMVRVVRETTPTFIFMENVPGVLRAENLRRIVDALKPMGYDMWWCMLPAYAVGAPQNRHRWFCLAVRSGGHRYGGATYVPKGSWSSKTQTLRLLPKSPKDPRSATQRCRMLGNAVVPDCARLAWNYLFSGGRVRDLRASPAFAYPDLDAKAVNVKDRFPITGAVIRGRTLALPPFPLPPKPNLHIVIDPRAYRGTPVNAVKHRVLSAPVAIPLWSTPRFSGVACSHVLTERTIRDLPCQLRFAASTPAAQRSGVVNPEWIEWLMGFPRGWTASGNGRSPCRHTKMKRKGKTPGNS